MSKALQDWLWELKCIEDGLDAYLPSRNVRVAYALSPPYKSDFASFGQPLYETEGFTPYEVQIQDEGPSGTRYVRLSDSYILRLCHHFGFSLASAWPDRDDLEERDFADVRICRYLSDDSHDDARGREKLIRGIRAMESAIVLWCGRVPTSPVEGAFKRMWSLGSWPLCILVLSLRRVHPYLLTQDCIEEPSIIGGPWPIPLVPDLRTATEYAFVVFRRAIEKALTNDMKGRQQSQSLVAADQTIVTASDDFAPANSLGGQTPGASAAPTPKTAALAERAKTAHAQYLRAVSECTGKYGRKPTDQECFDWLKEHSDGDQMPSFDTWGRYVRKARRHYGEPKNTPRTGRPTGRSIVSAQDIEPPSTDEAD